MDSYKYVGFARQQSFNYFLGQKNIFRELRKKRERVQKKRA